MLRVAVCILIALIIHMNVAAWRMKQIQNRVVTSGEILLFWLLNLAFSTTVGTFLYCILNGLFN